MLLISKRMYVKIKLGSDKMYSYIIGLVTGYDKNCVIIENNKIGYLINVTNPYNYKLNEEIKVYLYNHIKEDENSLYGFKSIEEKELFIKLINVKGIGPKMALPILSGDVSNIYNAINSGDVSYLKKFPKIGDKVAKQIILDLKGKLETDKDLLSNESKELIEVLESLGYKSIDIKKIISKIDINLPLEEQIKEALKMLGK